jgi:dTDP-4-dehydrorhamnose 3,5-epimerase
MHMIATDLEGVYQIRIERIEDERGSFARTFCRREFAEHGLDAIVAQCNVSHNRLAGTLRGLHYQLAPAAEAKLVRCTRGAIFDVAVDLRPNSPAFCRWFGAELSAANDMMLYIPKGFAHGFQTLEDDTEIAYQMSEYYAPELARGLRWDEPAVGIRWPLPVRVMSERDRQQPALDMADLMPLAEFTLQRNEA